MKKNKPQVYIAHPIMSRTLGSNHWKDEFLEAYGFKTWDFVLFDPSKDGLVDGRDNKRIVQANKHAISQSMAVVAYVETASAGVSMEIYFAHLIGVPVFSYSRVNIPAWVAEHSKPYATNSEILYELGRMAKYHARKV